jgi:hypothetical protein
MNTKRAIKNVVTFLRRQFPGKQQVWNPRTTYMCGKFGANPNNCF